MLESKIFVIAVLITCANSRHLFKKQSRSYLIIEDGDNISMYLLEKQMPERPKLIEQDSVSRVRRQAYGNINTNPDETSILGIKFPGFSGATNKILNYLPSLIKTADDGLTWDHINGYGASLIGNLIPKFGNKLTAAGKTNSLHDDNYDVTAQAFPTRNFPNNPSVLNFNTYGGKLGYAYDNKMGGSLGTSYTDLLKKMDLSAIGNLNLFKDHRLSLDLKAGFKKSMSPYIPSSRWRPFGGLSLTRFF